MDDIDTRLEEVLNLAPAEDIEEESTALELYSEAQKQMAEANKLVETAEVKEDLDFVRNKMREAIEMGADAMNELLALAKSSQGFEHFTAFASLMKSLNETNRNLLDFHKGVVEIETTVSPDANKPQVDPNVIIGTQNAVMKMIRDQLGVSRGLEAAAQTIVLKPDDPGLQK